MASMNPTELLEKLFCVNRSLTGPGVRETLSIIDEELGGKLTLHEIPSGTKVFDWVVPPEWRFHRAVMRPSDSWWKVFDTDAGDSLLHVVGYSAPVETTLPLNAPQSHSKPTAGALHVGPRELPNAIPYVTAYYAEPKTWGVCLSWEQFEKLGAGEYLIDIDSEFLENGSLTLADAVIPGTSKDEIMLSSYTCHPAGLANNETSGLVVLTEVVKWWLTEPRRHTLRVVLAPETIGPLAYLAKIAPNRGFRKDAVKAGFTLTCMGGYGSFTVQQDRKRSYASRMASSVLQPSRILGWQDRVSDERQWSAPGIDLPWATIFKTHPMDPEYAQRYHTSADDLNYVTAEQLNHSINATRMLLMAIEADRNWQVASLGEPQLSRRNLYSEVSKPGSSNTARPLLEVLSHCDGASTLEIAETLGQPFSGVNEKVSTLLANGLIREHKPTYPRYDLMLEYWESEKGDG